MSLSTQAIAQREREASTLKRFFKISAPATIGFYLLLGLGVHLFWHPTASIAQEEELEVIVDNQLDPPPQPQVKGDGGGGGGGGRSELSLFNPKPSDSPLVQDEFQSQPVDPDAVQVASVQTFAAIPLATPEEPEVVDPTLKPTPVPTVTPTPVPEKQSLPSTTPKSDLPKSDPPKSDKKPLNTAKAGGDRKLGTSTGSGGGRGDGTGTGRGRGVGDGSGGGVGEGRGPGTGSGSGAGREGRLAPTPSKTAPQPPATPQKPEAPVAAVSTPARQEVPTTNRKAPKCKSNCGLDEYLGGEGTARYSFDVDANGNVTNVRLRQSSGNPEIDRKAAEAIQQRKYEASEGGYEGQRIRVTSEQEGSRFQRQNEERRAQEAAERQEREQERQREAERTRPPITAEEPKTPEVAPIQPDRPAPEVPTPVTPPPTATPEAAPIPAATPEAPAPAPEPVAPVPEVPAAPAPEPAPASVPEVVPAPVEAPPQTPPAPAEVPAPAPVEAPAAPAAK
jgi:TonB family protein